MDEFSQDERTGGGLHLLDYLSVVLQRLPVAAGVFVMVVSAVAVYAWTRTPRYTATSRLLIESAGVNLTAMKDAYDPGRANTGQRDIIQTQVQLLKSAPVMEAVLQQGFLAQSAGFRKSKDPVRLLSDMVRIAPSRSGYVIDVSVERENPREAAQIVNAVVAAYLAENRSRRLGVSEDGIQELRKKSDDLRVKMDEATRELQGFMVSNRMVSFDDAQNIVVERLKGLNKNLMEAEPRRVQAEAQFLSADAAIKAGKPVESIPGVLESDIVKELKIELSRLEQKYSEMQSRLGEKHPQLQGLSVQIEALRTKVAMESAYILGALRERYDQNLREVEMLREELGKQEENVLRFNELAEKYNVLKQSRDSVQAAYYSIIRRIDELDVSRLSGQGDNVFVVARGEVPQVRSWPSRGRMMLMAIFVGGMLAVGACFFLDYMDTTVKGEADVRSLLGYAVLGGVPSAEAETEDGKLDDLFALKKPRSHFAEAFRTARTALAFSSTDNPLRSFVVTSTQPAEGKTLTAINLAIAHAQTGKRTLLVDTDMRKPRLNKVFASTKDVGISNLLAMGFDTAKIGEAVMSTEVENLFFLPTGPVPPNPVEMLDSARFGQLLEELLKQYELVIFDSPPALNLVDALVIGKRVDGLVLVIRTFVTPKNAAQQVVKQIVASKVKTLGTILNNVDQPAGSYYYYYSPYYSGRYGYGSSYYYEDNQRKKDKRSARWGGFAAVAKRLVGGRKRGS